MSVRHIVVLHCICFHLLGPGSAFAQQFSKEDVKRQWAANAERLKSLHIQIESVRFEEKPLRSKRDPDEGNHSDPIEQHSKTDIWLSNDDVAFEITHDASVTPWLGEFEAYSHNSSGSRSLSRMVRNGVRKVHGSVTKEYQKPEFGFYGGFLPLFLWYHFRSNGPLSLDFSNVTLRSSNVEIGGAMCIWLRSQREDPNFSTTDIYVNPKNSYSISRIVQSVRELPVYQADIEYQTGDHEFPKVNRWKCVWLREDGSQSVAESSRVIEFDPTWVADPKKFELQYPEGARVRLLDENGIVVSAGPNSQLIVPDTESKGFDMRKWLLGTASVLIIFSAFYWRKIRRVRG